MKVLHLYSGNLYGGIETLLSTLARLRHLAPEMQPEFGLCFHERLWDELAATGAVVHDLGPVRISRPWTVGRARRRLRRVLVSSGPDVVVTHDSWPHAVFAPVVRRARVRLVHLVHGGLNGRHWLERLAGRTAPEMAIANSRFTAGSIGQVFQATRVETWNYPVSPPADRPSRTKIRGTMETSEETVVILQASRLERWKGQAVHLEALGSLRDLPGWECWLAGGVQKAGEAEYLAELRAIAERYGITERVRFLGHRTDVADLMAAADIFCQPNTGPEPFGIVFVEALHAGLPVVTSGFGGAAEIVDQDCGVLTTPGDAADVAGAVRNLIGDPGLRRRLGAAGPGRAEALTNTSRQLEALYALLRSSALGGESDRNPGPLESRGPGISTGPMGASR